MGKGSWVQTAFHGGEWSPLFQGRLDHPKYKTGLNVCRNGYPIEEGAWVRRPGSRFLLPTYQGKSGKLYPVAFQTTAPYEVEFTDGAMRFFNGSLSVITPELMPVVSVSAANPAVVTLQSPVPWNTGDEIGFVIPFSTSPTIGQLLRFHVFTITVTSVALPPLWSNSTTYNTGALVTTTAAYAGGTTYPLSALVTFNGKTYISLAAGNVGNQPDISPSKWAVTGNVIYTSLIGGNLNNAPASSPTDWKLLLPGVTSSFTIADSVTGLPFDGSTITSPPALSMLAVRILRISTPYTAGAWQNARLIQSQDQAIVVNGTNPPQMLEIFPNQGGPSVATASLTQCQFQDGPYLDPVPNSIATTSGGLSGTITVTVAFAAWDSTVTYAPGNYVTVGGNAYQAILANINVSPPNATYWLQVDPGTAVTGDPNAVAPGFQATDVGRQMRLFSEPSLYSSTTAYVAGNVVAYNGSYYISNASQTGVSPDTIPVGSTSLSWILAPTAALWTWGTIASVLSKFSVTLNIQGLPLFYTVPVRTWRLGVYSNTTGYPKSGVYYEGRFWFGGALPNRFDCTMVGGVSRDGTVNMAPTAIDGTVGDANGISYTLPIGGDIGWFAPDHNGLMCGTYGGEWLISASNLSDPITPTSIQAKRVTNYGCANIEPRRTGIALVFVQKFGRKVLEFLSDVFTGRYIAPHLSETAKHLTAPGIAEIGYAEELAPILWVRTVLNALIGATYRRISAFTTEVPTFIGWHRHDLGTGRQIESMVVGQVGNGSLDQVAMITHNPTGSATDRQVEVFTQMFDQNDSIYDAWFVDGGVVPDNMYQDTVGGVSGERFTGLYYLIGQTVTVFAGGLDVGDFTVDANGTIFVPFGTGVQPAVIEYSQPGAGAWQFTAAYIQSVLALNFIPRNNGILLSKDTFTIGPARTLRGVTTYQAFVPTLNSGDQVRKDNMILDWRNNLAYVESLTNSRLRQFNMTNASELADPQWSAISGAPAPLNWVACCNNTAPIGGASASKQPYALYTGSDSGNYSAVVKVNEATMLSTYVAGVSSTFGPTVNVSGNIDNPGMINPTSIDVATLKNDWIVSIGTGGATRNITLCAGIDGSFVAGNGQSGAYQGIAAAPWLMNPGGALGSNVAAGGGMNNSKVTNADGSVVFTPTSTPFFVTAGDTHTLTIYVVEMLEGQQAILSFLKAGYFSGNVLYACQNIWGGPHVVVPVYGVGSVGSGNQAFGVVGPFFGKVGTLTPQQIDPTWTTITGVTGALVDKIDNNLMCIVQNTNASGNQQYLVKISTWPYNVDGFNNGSGSKPVIPFGVIWQIPLSNSNIADLGDMMARGSCRFGLFCFLAEQTAPNNHIGKLYRIDTTTGLYCIFAVPGVYHDISGHTFIQAYDDASNSLIFYGATDHTVPGAVARVNGSGDVSGTWCQLFIGTDLVKIGGNAPTCPTGYTITQDVTVSGFPCVVGTTYTSQGQLLRPVIPGPEVGAHIGGSGFAKTKRTNRFGIQVSNSNGLQVGTDFGATLHPIYFKDTGLKQILPTVTYSGVWRDSLADGYDYDSMLSWQILRPYPASIVAYGGFITTTDV